MSHQLEYCERAGTEGQSAPTTTGVGNGGQYGYEDEMDGGGSNETKQTVEQKCQAYIMASLSSKIDILKFWGVGNIVQSLCIRY